MFSSGDFATVDVAEAAVTSAAVARCYKTLKLKLKSVTNGLIVSEPGNFAEASRAVA